jgi:hypothetical protein
MSYTQHKHKRGDTFDLSGSVAATMDGAAVTDFTDWTGRCQVRNGAGVLVEELEFTWLDVTAGLVRVRSAASTDAWPLGPVRTDIQLTSPDGNVVSTDTAVIEVVEDITR